MPLKSRVLATAPTVVATEVPSAATYIKSVPKTVLVVMPTASSLRHEIEIPTRLRHQTEIPTRNPRSYNSIAASWSFGDFNRDTSNA
jgi:hypothetical protein